MLRWLVLCIGLACSPTWAGEILRVGTSGDYAPYSFATKAAQDWPAGLSGFDIEVMEAYARDRGLQIQWRPFRWPNLLDGLEGDDFDVAAGGITVRPERSVAGTYTVPLAQSGAVLLSQKPATSLAAIDQPGAVIAVNAGGHLERVARQLFQAADIRAVPDNARVLAQLDDPAVVGVVTDTGEAPHWMQERQGLHALGPLTADRKAWLVQPERQDLAADLDTWLLERELDGSLARWRAQYLGAGAERQTALVSNALLAAVDERLALMPWVAAWKLKAGKAVEDKAREEQVIASALAHAEAARPLDPAEREAVEKFFRLQIEAAKDIQRAVIEAGDAPSGPDLQSQLRPALIRIGARISLLLANMQGASVTADDLAAGFNAAKALSPQRSEQVLTSIMQLTTEAAPGKPVQLPAQSSGVN